jgi:hypothetical protein
MPTRPIEARGYFRIEGSKFLGSEYRDLYHCGYAKDEDKNIVEIAFLLIALTDNGHDYKGKQAEIPQIPSCVSAAYWNNNANADEIRDNYQLIKDESKYFNRLTNLMHQGGMEKEEIVDLLMIFTTDYYLGRTFAEVRQTHTEWKFNQKVMNEQNEEVTVPTFMRCSLEHHGA